MKTQKELTDQVQGVSLQLNKISAESTKTLEKVTALQAVIDAGPTVTPELQAAVDALAAQAQAVDDLTPDLPVDPVPTSPMRSPGPGGSSTAATGTSGSTTAEKPVVPPADDDGEPQA